MEQILWDMRHSSAKAVRTQGYKARDARHAGGPGGWLIFEENHLWDSAAS